MFSNIGSIIENRINELLTETTVYFDNVAANPITGENCIRITDIGGKTNLISGTADSGINRLDGTAIVEVFVPLGSGKRESDELCDLVFNKFVNYINGNFKCYSIQKQRIGEDNAFFKQNVIIYYQYDKCNVN